MRSILIDIQVAVCILEPIYISDIAEVNKAAGAIQKK
jgi:hypothetical protein